MNFYLNNDTDHLFILGAGASVEYGLPTWNQLGPLIKEKISKDAGNNYHLKNEILEWIDKIDKNKYVTLDECISIESDQHHNGGLKVENELFRIIKDIFNELYQDSNSGWIEKLNLKILYDRKMRLEQRMAFINYNYDHVLDNHFLNFDSRLSDKKKLIYKTELYGLSRAEVETFFPHGNFLEELPRASRLNKHQETIKTGDRNYLDVVSCHDSQEHTIGVYNHIPRKLYILGLGGGLIFNLNKEDFSLRFSEVHVTIQNKALETEIVKFLGDKFGFSPSDIKIYDSCGDLIEKCF